MDIKFSCILREFKLKIIYLCIYSNNHHYYFFKFSDYGRKEMQFKHPSKSFKKAEADNRVASATGIESG